VIRTGTGAGQAPVHTAAGAAGKAIKAAGIPDAIAVTPDGTTACIAGDGPAPVTPIRTAASAGHRCPMPDIRAAPVASGSGAAADV